MSMRSIRALAATLLAGAIAISMFLVLMPTGREAGAGSQSLKSTGFMKSRGATRVVLDVSNESNSSLQVVLRARLGRQGRAIREKSQPLTPLSTRRFVVCNQESRECPRGLVLQVVTESAEIVPSARITFGNAARDVVISAGDFITLDSP